MKNKQTKQRLMPYNSNHVHEAFESKYGTYASGGEMLRVNVNVKKKMYLIYSSHAFSYTSTKLSSIVYRHATGAKETNI